MATLSREQTAQILYQVGFRGDALWKMVAIAGRESAYNPAAHRTDQAKSALSGDLGLFQINYVNHQRLLNAGVISSKADLFDPVKNAAAAYFLSGGGSNLGPWTAGPGGWTAGGDPLYGTNQTAARQAVTNAANQGLLGANWQGSSSSGSTSSPTSSAPYSAGPAPFPNSPPIAPYTAAPPDPAMVNEMSSLLGTLGVSYSNAPRPTPALLAFLKGIGLNLSTAEDLKRRAIERIGASTSDALSDIDRAAGRTKENITADVVRRNVLSSGEANKRYARHEEDVGESRSDVQRASTEATEAAESSYTQATQVARQQALDRVIGAEQEQSATEATRAAQTDSFRRQQEAADVAWQRQWAAQEESTRRQEELLRNQGAA